MTRPDARLLQVSLTGTRLANCSDEELLARLQSRFKLPPAQSAALLKGRCVVKRGVDAASAQKLVAVLVEVGLEARVEAMPPPVSPLKAVSPQVVARPAAVAAGEAAEETRRVTSPQANRAQPARPAAPTRPTQRVQPVQQAQQAQPAQSPQSAQPVRPVRPAQAAQPPQPSAAPLEALQALAGQRLPNPRTNLAYLAGLLLVTLLSVALPAIYVGLTGGIAVGWIWYLTHIHHHLPKNAYLIALTYAVPGVVGAMLVVFLLRPLFVARPRPRRTLTLDPEREASFVAGVHALCRAIGVSPPIEIRLSWDANASVQFRTRWLSLFSGHKVLTIGLSLVSGLTARQFVGVLAHEFGHFAQRLGMICSFTVNSINAWLEYCAYGEDTWGRKLREWSDEVTEKDHWFSWLVSLSIFVSGFAIGLTRHLMAALFHLSLRLSRYMSRQMEFDADRYEALLAGSEMFRVTARSLRALHHSFAEVNRANIEAWQEHKLLADLPDAVADYARAFGEKRLAAIDAEMREETTTRYWDSHPPDIERIDNAEKRRCPGIYKEEAPAALLFRDFAGWSQRATRLFYAEQEVQFTDAQLRSREEILGHVRRRTEQREQLHRFFNGQFQEWPLLQLRRSQAVDKAVDKAADADRRAGWQDCIDRIRALSPEIARNWLQAYQAHERRSILRTAVKLSADSQQMGLPGPTRSAQDLAAELGEIAACRLDFQKHLELGFSLYSLRVGHAVDSMSQSEYGGEAAQLRDTLAALGSLEREAALLEEVSGAMRAFGSIAEHQGSMPPGFEELESTFAEHAAQLIAKAQRIPQSVTVGGTVGAYLSSCCRELSSAGANAAPSVLARAYWPLPGAFHHFYLMALGELVSLCEAAEKGRGIRPIRLVA